MPVVPLILMVKNGMEYRVKKYRAERRNPTNMRSFDFLRKYLMHSAYSLMLSVILCLKSSASFVRCNAFAIRETKPATLSAVFGRTEKNKSAAGIAAFITSPIMQRMVRNVLISPNP